MTLVAVGSVKGSPGVTTACLGLGACWPGEEQPVVVECDPAGGDLLARWGLRLSPGLMSLAAAARRSGGPGLVWQHVQRLPGGLAVVAGPAGAGQARAALEEFSAVRGPVLRWAADRAGTVVIADCGRIDPGSAVLPVVRQADVLLLLTRAGDDALSHLAVCLEEIASWCERRWVVLVGGGYSTAEVCRVLDIEVLGRLPHDPRGAAAWCGRPGGRSAPTRSALGRAMTDLAAQVSMRVRPEPPATDQRGLVEPQAEGDGWGRRVARGPEPVSPRGAS